MHENTKDLSAILAKLRKLLAHQQSAEAIGSLAEAEAFAAKISSLCDQYRISIAQLEPEQIREAVSIESWEKEGKGQSRRPLWLYFLCSGIGYGHHCRTLSNPRSWNYFYVGLKEDVAVCVAMTDILIKAMDQSFSRLKGQGVKKLSYYKGFSMAIAARYRAKRDEQKREQSGQALMRLTDKIIDEFVHEHFDEEKPRRVIVKTDFDFHEGFKDGLRQSLEEKVIDPAKKQRLLNA